MVENLHGFHGLASSRNSFPTFFHTANKVFLYVNGGQQFRLVQAC